MKLIIQIPCLNEEDDAPGHARRPPARGARASTSSSGWSSTTARPTARSRSPASNGVDHIVRLTNNKGLAAGFQAGLDAVPEARRRRHRQHRRRQPVLRRATSRKLVAPILAGSADMVVGDREVTTIEHFSPLKKSLQRLGSWVVRQASDTDVPDTTSGFRAYNREAAMQMAVVSKFTYTLETIIQAGKLLVATDHVPIRTNPKTRESRLFPSMWSYVRRNAVSIFRIYAQYEPLRVFMTLALIVGARRAGRLGALPRRLHRAATAPATSSR